MKKGSLRNNAKPVLSTGVYKYLIHGVRVKRGIYSTLVQSNKTWKEIRFVTHNS